MRLVRQENLEQLTVALTRCTIERVNALAKQHAVSADEIVRALIANALLLEDDLATRYDEMSRRLEQLRAVMSVEKREVADQAVLRAMDSVLELEEYTVVRALYHR